MSLDFGSKLLQLNLVDEYSDDLLTPTEAWDFQKYPLTDLQMICQSMIYVMIKGGGIGLAANQVGLKHSIFVFGTGEQFAAIINPEILETSGEQVDTEGCLSAPGLFLKVKRPMNIKVRFYGVDGVQRTVDYSGMTARVFLHEYEHLQGIRFQDKVSPILLQHARSKVKQNLKKIREIQKRAEADHLRKRAEVQAAAPTLSLTDHTKAMEAISATQPGGQSATITSFPPSTTPVPATPLIAPTMARVDPKTVLDFTPGAPKIVLPTVQRQPDPKPAIELDFIPTNTSV